MTGALAGHLTESTGGRELIVSLPIRDSAQVVGAVRASSTTGNVWQRTLLTWSLMGGLAAVAAGGAALLADRQATHLTRPPTDLAATDRLVFAQEIGRTGFTLLLPPT
ncbi:hypothetical protein [Cryptosporangium phraense]|uniref:Two-component sensor histidine kinase n=1 Tax=Cryptosporangium phraense TaxID=2593070 RepID=A0A545AVE8_9ACTN|nr:hypothetical protein [Cryptosporangium phraense]TQS45312.1 hypothetical protein FL583_09455 [Cryptosporangium phraense]